MNANMRITEFSQIQTVIQPVNLATGANAGDWINAANYMRTALVVVAAVGTAGSDLTVNLMQAKDNTGTDAKALDFTRIDIKQGVSLAAVGEFTRVDQAASNSYVNTDNGESELVYVLDVQAADLDIDNDFTHLTVDIPAVGAAKIGSVVAMSLVPKFGEEPQLSNID